MFKRYFLLFLLGHVVGDFYAQTPSTVKKKEESMKWVLIHCFTYLVVTGLVLLTVISAQIFKLGLVLAAKSIARYDRIVNDKPFAEYYLLGTLLSTAIVMAVSKILL